MDTRNLNTMNQTRGRITKEQFMIFEEVRASGKINMFGFNTDIQREDNYEKCYDWFITNNFDSNLSINLNDGLVEVPLVEREDGTIYDPETGNTVFEKNELNNALEVKDDE